MMISRRFAVFCFFSKKGLTFVLVGVLFAPLFGGRTSAPRGTEKLFLKSFQKGVDANFVSRMLSRPSFGGALPINGREFWLWSFCGCTDFGSDGPMFFEN